MWASLLGVSAVKIKNAVLTALQGHLPCGSGHHKIFFNGRLEPGDGGGRGRKGCHWDSHPIFLDSFGPLSPFRDSCSEGMKCRAFWHVATSSPSLFLQGFIRAVDTLRMFFEC